MRPRMDNEFRRGAVSAVMRAKPTPPKKNGSIPVIENPSPSVIAESQSVRHQDVDDEEGLAADWGVIFSEQKPVKNPRTKTVEVFQLSRCTLTHDERRRDVQRKVEAGRIADDLTKWCRSLIDELRRIGNAAWTSEQLACRLGREHGECLSAEEWELLWHGVMLQPLGDRCNRALNVIERTAADVLLSFYRKAT